LLDAVRYVPHGGHDAAVPGDVIEKLQVMNVHISNELMLPPLLSIDALLATQHTFRPRIEKQNELPALPKRTAGQ